MDRNPKKVNNRLAILRMAVPVILANASAPLLGLADTAVIGRTGTARELGAIALGALIFSFVYWGFGFLRMGTTGFIAQAVGAGDKTETRLVLLRSLTLGLGIGLLIVLLQTGIGWLALRLLSASNEVTELVSQYFYIRIWGAPACLATFALMGTLIGLGHTRKLLIAQLFLNGVNILLNVFFVLALGWSVRGIALGTLIAEWLTLTMALWLVAGSMKFDIVRGFKDSWATVLQKRPMLSMLKTNSDIMIRTLALLSGFAWFTNQGAKFGDATLAANHILLQFVSLSAFFLDGFAYVLEMLSGQAFGAKDRTRFMREVRDATLLAGGTALLLALLFLSGGALAIDLLTSDRSVREIAVTHLPYAAIYIAISFFAFQLDGIFIGTMRSREMRNAGIVSLMVFIGLGLLLVGRTGNQGLWLAFIVYVLIRGITLYAYFPRLMKSLGR